MRYIRQYNKEPKPVKWKYFDTTRHITPNSIVTSYYWPTQDRLAFAFNSGTTGEVRIGDDDEAEAIGAAEDAVQKTGYSSSERQLQVLREIVGHTNYPVYLLDEWDANLDPANRAAAVVLVDELARRARVIEVSHRD